MPDMTYFPLVGDKTSSVPFLFCVIDNVFASSVLLVVVVGKIFWVMSQKPHWLDSIVPTGHGGRLLPPFAVAGEHRLACLLW